MKNFFLKKLLAKIRSNNFQEEVNSNLNNVYWQNISLDNQFIFIHIPKNAGTSIARTLGLKVTSHHTSQEIANLIGNKYQDFFKFCFVRNPWDRFLSLYNYARLKESYYHSAINPEKALYGKHLDYDLLSSASLKECAYYLMEGKLKHDHCWNQWNPQYTWIVNDTGKIIVDYIGHVEKMKENFTFITKRLGITNEIVYKNTSSQKKVFYRDCYDLETKKIVEEFYKKDIEIFGYEF